MISIFEMTSRNIRSLVAVTQFSLLIMPLIILGFFWRRPGYLFFTYVIPVIPFVFLWDAVVSCLRTRTPEETIALLKDDDLSRVWTFSHGIEPLSKTYDLMWFAGFKESGSQDLKNVNTIP